MREQGIGPFGKRAIRKPRQRAVRFTSIVLEDQHDEWQDGRRHFSQQSMARLLHPDGPPLLTNPLTGGIAT